MWLNLQAHWRRSSFYLTCVVMSLPLKAHSVDSQSWSSSASGGVGGDDSPRIFAASFNAAAKLYLLAEDLGEPLIDWGVILERAETAELALEGARDCEMAEFWDTGELDSGTSELPPCLLDRFEPTALDFWPLAMLEMALAPDMALVALMVLKRLLGPPTLLAELRALCIIEAWLGLLLEAMAESSVDWTAWLAGAPPTRLVCLLPPAPDATPLPVPLRAEVVEAPPLPAPLAVLDSVDWMLLEPPLLIMDRTLWPPPPAARLPAVESRVEPNLEPCEAWLAMPLFMRLPPVAEVPLMELPTWELALEPGIRLPAWLPRDMFDMADWAISSPGPARISDVCDW